MNKYYNNIFCASYLLYSKFKNETPKFASVCVVWLCHFAIVALLITINKKFTGRNLFGIFPNKYYVLAIGMIWLIVLHFYYSDKKIIPMIEAYKLKQPSEQKLWFVLGLTSCILPIVGIALLLQK